MKRSNFTEEQIISLLREQEAGATTAEVCRRHGISSAKFHASLRRSLPLAKPPSEIGMTSHIVRSPIAEAEEAEELVSSERS